MILYDERKRKINLKKHGIDFAECAKPFDFPMITKEDCQEDYGEQRFQSLCRLDSRIIFMVWMNENDCPRVISAREATKYEEKFYFSNIDH